MIMMLIFKTGGWSSRWCSSGLVECIVAGAVAVAILLGSVVPYNSQIGKVRMINGNDNFVFGELF
jgi:hypothetical protein